MVVISLLETLLIIDTLRPIAANPSFNLSTFLSSLINPHISLLAVSHLDVPLPSQVSPYAPDPSILLRYLATTIFTVYSLSHLLARKRAVDRSLAEPVFGLSEETEGVISGIGSNDPRGVVLEMEHRRKSGRGVSEWFFLPSASDQAVGGRRLKETIILLEDHPVYRQQQIRVDKEAESDDQNLTFNFGLTEKQRKDRDGVILPYFDAQKEGGGMGGRILYDMGVEDDFDEEEDEI